MPTCIFFLILGSIHHILEIASKSIFYLMHFRIILYQYTPKSRDNSSLNKLKWITLYIIVNSDTINIFFVPNNILYNPFLFVLKGNVK